jgi:hypothetical protein
MPARESYMGLQICGKRGGGCQASCVPCDMSSGVTAQCAHERGKWYGAVVTHAGDPCPWPCGRASRTHLVHGASRGGADVGCGGRGGGRGQKGPPLCGGSPTEVGWRDAKEESRDRDPGEDAAALADTSCAGSGWSLHAPHSQPAADPVAASVPSHTCPPPHPPCYHLSMTASPTHRTEPCQRGRSRRCPAAAGSTAGPCS